MIRKAIAKTEDMHASGRWRRWETRNFGVSHRMRSGGNGEKKGAKLENNNHGDRPDVCGFRGGGAADLFQQKTKLRSKS